MSWIEATHLDWRPDETAVSLGTLCYRNHSLVDNNLMQFPLMEIGILYRNHKIYVYPYSPIIVRSPDNAALVKKVTARFTHCSATTGPAEVQHPDWNLSGEVEISLAGDGSFHCVAKLRNNCSYPVVEVLMPRLGPLVLSSEHQLLYPHHAGEKIRNIPTALASTRYQRFWRAASVQTAIGFAREINYCGLASMPWMDLNDKDISLYTASYDPSFPITGLRVETGGPENPWVSLSFRKYVTIEPHHSYSSPEIVWRLHTDDWHEAAGEYRKWFDSYVTQSPVPEDLRTEVVVSPHYSFRRHEGITHRYEDIPGLVDRDDREFGSRHFFVAGWNHLGFDSHYPDYNPDLELGTPLKLYEGVRYREEKDGFTTFYINARIMDTQSEYLHTLGEKWMIKDEKGASIHETYGPASAIVLCPSHPEWRQYLEEFAVWMCQAYGARGIYFDQLGSAPPLPCYSSHEHDTKDPTAGFNEAYVSLLEKTQKRLRSVRSDAFLMIENCGDIYSSRVWGSLVWNGEDYDEFFGLYKFTFPEHTLICMVNPRRLYDSEQQEQVFYQDLARAVALGSVLWFDGNAFDQRVTDNQRKTKMLKTLQEALQLRREIAPVLARARFMDTVGVTVPEDVFTSRWQMHNSEILLVANPDRVQGRTIKVDCLRPGGGTPQNLKRLTSSQMYWTDIAAYPGVNFSVTVPESAFSVFTWSLRSERE